MTDIHPWLQRAASWRFASLLFQEPRGDRTRELEELAALVPEDLRAVAMTLAAATSAREETYFRALGPGGCPASESAYDRAALANRGPLIADVSAFYEAFAYPPRLTSELTPDHIAVELDFLAFMALKTAFAVDDGRPEHGDVAQSAYVQFLDEHPRFWIRDLHGRLDSAGDEPYAEAAAWVASLVEREGTAASCV